MDRMHPRWLVAAAIALFATACAQSSGDISYVQPNYMKKSDLLDGVWYIRNTVTDTPATTGFTFTGETGDLEKIVWEIQEGYLVGYRSYPTIPGQDPNVEDSSRPSGVTTKVCNNGTCVGGQKYYGTPVVVYRIEKHFDIQRGYDPATGEEGNTIRENSSDREWHEREYIRVDWMAQQHAKNLAKFGMMNPTGASSFASLIYANEPGTDPYDWPRAEYKDVGGEQKLQYFEFTGRYMARPTSIYFPGYGEIPYCWLRSVGHLYDCTSQQIEMRTSIAKVDPVKTADYEPLVYDNNLMAKFGYFRTERLNYDRRFGINESDVLYLANRHRVWNESYRKNADGSVDWAAPIPFAERNPKPIVYYFTPKNRMGGEDEWQQYWESAKILERNWDVAFRRAVAAAQGKSADQVPQMLYVCENPVPAGAPAACGAQGFEARFGDLRYNFLWTIAEAVPNGLLGYGPSSPDPETGEIISANANQYSAAMARSAQNTQDVVNILSGDMSIEDFINGDDVLDYMNSNPSYASVLGRTGAIQSELQGEIQRSSDSTQGAFARTTAKLSGKITQLRAGNGLPVAGGDRERAAAEILKQYPLLESALIDSAEISRDVEAMLPQMMNVRTDMDPAITREAVKGFLLRPREALALEKQRIETASRRNIYLSDFYENREMISLAFRESQKRSIRITELMGQGMSQVEAKKIADQEMKRRFRQHLWRGTAEHEIGHTFGLRHNFQGSFDAVNYFDDYWDMKKQTLTVQQNGFPVVPRTPADMKAASDGTEEQLYGAMHEYEYASIMDYGGKANADWQGIGKYDEAAILFAYSGGKEPGYVEVFDVDLPTETRQFAGSDGKALTVTGAGYDLPVVNALRKNTAVPNYTERFHYTTVPLRFGHGNQIDQVIESGIQNLRARKIMKWSEVKAKTEEVKALLATNPEPAPQAVAAINPPLEVPYMFCTDDHAGYLLSCHRWDRGPDYYEINRTWLESYWNNYFFTHFRRDRFNFSSDPSIYSAYGTFDNASMVYKHWVHALYGAAGSNTQNIPNYATGKFGYDPLVQDYWTMATFDGINNALQVLAVPQHGFFLRRQLTDEDTGESYGRWDMMLEGPQLDELSPEGKQRVAEDYSAWYRVDDVANSTMWMPRGLGRSTYSRWDYESGFGWQWRQRESGHYNDQIGTLFGMTWPVADFLGVDRFADQNRYYIPYYLLFRDELNSSFGALWAYNEDARRPTMWIDKNTGKPEVSYPVFVKAQDYVSGFNYPQRKPVPTNNPSVGFANIATTWSARVYSLYLGLQSFNVNYDLDFAKRNQVVKLGGAEEFTVPVGYEKVELEDFTTGARYVAVQPVGAAEDYPGVTLIKLGYDYLEIIDNPCLALPASLCGNAAEEQSIRDQYTEAFRDVTRDLDMMRMFFKAFGKAF